MVCPNERNGFCLCCTRIGPPCCRKCGCYHYGECRAWLGMTLKDILAPLEKQQAEEK